MFIKIIPNKTLITFYERIVSCVILIKPTSSHGQITMCNFVATMKLCESQR